MPKKHLKRRRKHKPGFLLQYFRALRLYLVTGLLVWVPLIITVWLTWWLFRKVGMGQENLVKSGYDWLNRVGATYSDRFPLISFLEDLHYKPGYGFLIAVALFLTTGFLTRYIVGRRIISTGENILNRIPLISRVYRAVRQIRDVFVNRQGTIFQRVCLVQYPRNGVYAVAFITSTEKGIVQESAREKLTAVFLPTTPNPTSGFLLYFPPDEVIPLDISVEEAMKLIISGGAYLPGHHDVIEFEDERARARKAKAALPKKAETPNRGKIPHPPPRPEPRKAD